VFGSSMLSPFIGTASVPYRGVYEETCRSWNRFDITSWIKLKFEEIDSFLTLCKSFMVSGDILRSKIDRYLLFGDVHDFERYIGWDVFKEYDTDDCFGRLIQHNTNYRICLSLAEWRIHEIVVLRAEAESGEVWCDQDAIGSSAKLFTRNGNDVCVEDIILPLNKIGKQNNKFLICCNKGTLVFSELYFVETYEMGSLYHAFRSIASTVGANQAVMYKKKALAKIFDTTENNEIVNALADMAASGKGLLVPIDDNGEHLWNVLKIIQFKDDALDGLPDEIIMSLSGKCCEVLHERERRTFRTWEIKEESGL